MKDYPRAPRLLCRSSTVLSSSALPKRVDVPCEHVGACILVHGVNDVGVGFQAVEAGLCKGLAERMKWFPDQPNHTSPYTPARYRMPTTADARRLEDDPDAVFYKRQLGADTHSPVIPFYWGYRDIPDESTVPRNGQNVDTHGNRLDKDRSKGGGPFANATSNLVDMWNRGAPSMGGLIDFLSGDPIRPVLNGPGRMYFVLAAQRLAALVRMIRKYDANDTVNIVAHSQGCLIALLAQAFLMEEGHPTADTLVLTHPPYGLETTPLGHFSTGAGEDEAMKAFYTGIDGMQTVRARLDTLINIVKGVADRSREGWSPQELAHLKSSGIHSTAWKPGEDRDNRGKVYLYFCPEDMTVALRNVEGIGWQGVPDQLTGLRPPLRGEIVHNIGQLQVEHRPLQALGPTFLQRVFTRKIREVDGQQTTFKVGLTPRHFALRLEGENDQSHVRDDITSLRMNLPEVSNGSPTSPAGRRFINGEALREPHSADLYAGALSPDPKAELAKLEAVDPIDAAVAISRDRGIKQVHETIPDPRPAPARPAGYDNDPTWQSLGRNQLADVQALLNKGKAEGDQVKLSYAGTRAGRKLFITRPETPNEARLRHQQSTSSRSFHSAIWASKANHTKVTAYDIAIGQGRAVSDKDFYAYLCAVADWRLKDPPPNERIRPGILTWESFSKRYGKYFECERDDIKKIVRGNCDYYSNGVMPACVPTIAQRPPAVVAETTTGLSVPITPRAVKKA
ncbi:MAG: DUF3274 domain-containing protein [Zoogloea sp.]|uniref:T6SS effector phospholipase Tle3 domain-containing protein n=1 Tax=Zoogloea sp. TaxID=49181 RepID=UPI00262A4599|nr:DUF3274 domain-containing protein [Zoogloea sp.]MDD3329567.1 DUF3274 domain-containing protein [Zoogloea sp.]